MDKNLALEFVRVTEAAAIEASKFIGKGNGKEADGVAVEAMRSRFKNVDFSGQIVIGEGKKDEAPELYVGEKLGTGVKPELDVAVDPLECTDSVAFGRFNAQTVIATGPKGTLLSAPDTYMEKIAVPPAAKGKISLDFSVDENIKIVAKCLKKDISDITVSLLDRDRNKDIVSQIRKTGARVRLVTDGDLAIAIATCLENNPIDMLLGSGGSAEAVLASCALKTLGGEMQARFLPRNEEDKAEIERLGLDVKNIYTMDDLAKGDNVTFTATGVIDGPILNGVVWGKKSIITHSVSMRSISKTIRFITTHHHVGS
jgi:fructose-1,6-bisphosphatase II